MASASWTGYGVRLAFVADDAAFRCAEAAGRASVPDLRALLSSLRGAAGGGPDTEPCLPWDDSGPSIVVAGETLDERRGGATNAWLAKSRLVLITSEIAPSLVDQAWYLMIPSPAAARGIALD